MTTTLVDPLILDSKAFDQLWPESLSLSADSVEVRTRIMHIANVCLRRKTQKEAFAMWVNGKSTAEIAEATGRAVPDVHKTLFGLPGRTDFKGAVYTVRTAIESDEVFQAMATKGDKPSDPLNRGTLAYWFRGVPADRFIEMAALISLTALADAEGWLSVSDAYGAMSPSVVTHALPRLRWGGFIQTDGIRIKIIKKELIRA